MSSTRWLCVLIWLASSGCGETRIVQGTRESASTGDSQRDSDPMFSSIDPSTGAAVSLIDLPDAGASPPVAGMGGSVPDAAVAEPETVPEPEPEPAPEPEPEPEPDVEVALAPAPQLEHCGADMSCDLKCTSDACAMTCDDANKCKVDCGDASSTCDVSCRGANNCEPKCRAGSCEFDCTDANNCDHLRCEGDAQCLARCTGANNCKWEDCEDPQQCADDVIVCNRECPR